ncbi:MAG TPA: hypothetical protein V6D29_02650 [Leptolyngbyaceae cyanobacterium]
MGLLKKFEIYVLRLLMPTVLSAEQIDAVISEGEFVSYDYSGSGYFLTIKHPSLPTDRTVCSKPTVMGQAGEIVCGFILFMENHELTLECHSWETASVPEGFREGQVDITVV